MITELMAYLVIASEFISLPSIIKICFNELTEVKTFIYYALLLL
jgi:hypothetical protein